MVDICVDTLSDTGVITMATSTIILEFVDGVAYAADTLSDMVINVLTVIDVEMLAVENANDLADVMNAL